MIFPFEMSPSPEKLSGVTFTIPITYVREPQVNVKHQFAGTAPEDVENCTNRSPYPTLHLLREASIERAVDAYGDTDVIFERNIETLRRLGAEGWRRLVRRPGS